MLVIALSSDDLSDIGIIKLKTADWPANSVYPPANLIKLEDCITDAGNFLLDIAFLMKQTYRARMMKIKQFLLRAEIKDEEVALVRGIINQARWAIKNKND